MTFAHCNTKQLHNYEIVKVYKLDSNIIQILRFDIKKCVCFLCRKLTEFQDLKYCVPRNLIKQNNKTRI